MIWRTSTLGTSPAKREAKSALARLAHNFTRATTSITLLVHRS